MSNAAKNQRVSEAMSAAGDPTPPPPTQSKRAKPQASPEFAQARIRRDLRLLAEREASVRETFARKSKNIDTERARLHAELAVVEAALTPAAPGKDS